MPHSYDDKIEDEGPPDQGPAMANPISRPEPHWKIEDGLSQTIKYSWAACILGQEVA